MTLVLIVDDVPAVAQQYAYDLKRLGGHEALAARSGEEALEILSREPVDCVILDLEMPGMDGFEVLRAMERRAIRVPVIVESGAGKELVARDLHRLGGRPAGPFIALNSAALPHDLVESELFGHERGAFTGAVAVRKGAFEAASGGTLFLDEIGDLPPAAQAKLLRVLEQREVTRVGGTRAIAVDARVVAATHRQLEDEVKEQRFREDLFYRLNVHVLRVPPLRERRSDVPELAAHLLAATCARFGGRAKRFGSSAVEALMGYDWARNNVRELRNVIERMVIATDREELTVEDVPVEVRKTTKGVAGEALRERRTGEGEKRSFQELKTEAERQIILAALERNAWHITRTAEALGLADHSSLLKVMKRHGISRE